MSQYQPRLLSITKKPIRLKYSNQIKLLTYVCIYVCLMTYVCMYIHCMLILEFCKFRFTSSKVFLQGKIQVLHNFSRSCRKLLGAGSMSCILNFFSQKVWTSSRWCITASLNYKNTMINIITMETVACLRSKCHLKQNLNPSWPCSWKYNYGRADFLKFVGPSGQKITRTSNTAKYAGPGVRQKTKSWSY
jgi:hypothetical protein